MKIDRRETTTVEAWVLLKDVVALVKDVRGEEDDSGPWYRGWEAACDDIVEALEEREENL